jgi:hypothetical protein
MTKSSVYQSNVRLKNRIRRDLIKIVYTLVEHINSMLLSKTKTQSYAVEYVFEVRVNGLMANQCNRDTMWLVFWESLADNPVRRYKMLIFFGDHNFSSFTRGKYDEFLFIVVVPDRISWCDSILHVYHLRLYNIPKNVILQLKFNKKCIVLKFKLNTNIKQYIILLCVWRANVATEIIIIHAIVETYDTVTILCVE